MADILPYNDVVCHIWKCAQEDLLDVVQSAAEFEIAKSQFI